MVVDTYIVDAFTDTPFSGNPAGVCIVDTVLEDSMMQKIASELNLSETVFVRTAATDGVYTLQYFTPRVEIDFCGHATLASARVLFDISNRDTLTFRTHKGLQLSAYRKVDGIKLIFPLYTTLAYQVEAEFLAALGVAHPVDIQYGLDLKMLLVEVKSKEDLEQLTPDFTRLLKFDVDILEVVVTCKSYDPTYDFYSRCFCPWIGIDEDPVTGSAHALLARYWGSKLGKDTMSAYQLSQRGGYMNLEIIPEDKVAVYSDACIVFRGKLYL